MIPARQEREASAPADGRGILEQGLEPFRRTPRGGIYRRRRDTFAGLRRFDVCRIAASFCVLFGGRAGIGSESFDGFLAQPQAPAPAFGDLRKRTVSPAFIWPSFHNSADNYGGTDESAEAWAIRTKQDRHVAGEVDGSDCIGVVVNIRGMQAGFAAVFRAHSGLGPTRRIPVRSD
jgi:hypothetical protein